MSLPRSLGRTGAVWFLPLLFALSSWYGVRYTVRIGYAAGDLAQAGIGLYLAAPMTAAFVAFRTRGFLGFLEPLRPGRSGVRAVLRAWWPLVLGAPTAVCLGVVVAAGAVPDDGPSWSLVVLDFVTVLAAALTGAAGAWALPVVVAVPLVAMAWFVWIAYAPASASPTLHNLTPTLGCCTSETRPASVAVEATLLLLVVITLGIGCVLASSQAARLPRVLVASVLVGVVGGGVGAGLAVLRSSGQVLTLTATEARTTALSCRPQHDLEVCLWPENQPRAAAVATVVARLNPRLRRSGLDPIVGLTQAGRDRAAVSVEAGAGLSEQDLRAGVAVGYVDLQSGCRGASGAARDRLVAAVALLSGMPTQDVASRYGAGAAAEAHEVLGPGPTPALGAWFGQRLHQVRCEQR